jgi:hypothetical protein
MDDSNNDIPLIRFMLLVLIVVILAVAYLAWMASEVLFA